MGGAWSSRAARLIGVVVLAWLVLLAWWFYLERTACFDSAWFSWLMIDTGLPQSFLGRYGSWLPQLLPVALVHLHADLETVLRTYSLCLVGVHVVLFWVVAFRLRDEEGTVALPLALLAGLHLMFYYGTSELNQGISLTVLVWVLVKRTLDATEKRDRIRWGTTVFVVSAWTSFYHQVLLLPLVYVMGMELVRRREWRAPWPWIVSSTLIAWYVVRIKWMGTTSYEQERMPGLADVFAQLPKLRELPSTKYLLDVFPKFKALLLLMAVTIVCAAWLKRYLLAAWTAVFTTGLLVLILITDRQAGSPTMYENFYPLGAVCWGIAFAGLYPELRSKVPRAATFSLLLLAVVGCVQVYRGHSTVSAKVDHLERLTGFLRPNGIRKAFMEEACYPWAYGFSTWQLPFESALVSGVCGPQQAVTVFCGPDDLKLDTMYHNGNAFLGPAWMPLWFTSDHLNPAYFRFHHNGFRRMNTAMPDSVWASFPAEGVRIVARQSGVVLDHDRTTVVELSVTNASPQRLCSMTEDGEPLRFQYTLYDENGQLYAEHAQRTALECDIPAGASYVQGLIMERPVNAGRYRVMVWLGSEVLRRPDIGTSFWIEARRF